jgi:alpha-tubulin suppressor-like RCC1 family protein
MQATIRDQVTGASVTTAVVNGGFDPVAIAADVGDTLVVEITRSGAVAPLRAMETVRANHPPVVVRTSPPRGGRDVPLNAAMVVVFSDPIDSGTLIPGAIQLWQDATAIPGTVLFSDSLGLRAEFHPDSLLAWQTAYRFVVTRAIRDVNGMPLDSVVEVGFTTAITPPTTGLVFALVSVGHGHTCGVTTAGKTYCWGANNNGQFGDGTYDNIRGTPVPAAAGLPLTSVSAGLDATCGVTTDGAAYCWGPYWGITQGMFDSVAVANNCSPYGCPTPLPVPGGHTFKMVSFRVGHACGVTTDGAAYCWGTNESGQLGIDSATLVSNCRDASPGNGIGGCPTPLRVAGGLTFATVSTGEHHTCGLTTDGAAYCWGSNASGQLGAGTTFGPEQCGVAGSTFPCSRVPVAVIGGLSFTEISAGYNYTCGVVSTGAAYCWGYNAGGELGSGSTAGPQVCIYDPYNSAPCSPSPVPVAGGLVFRMISAGWDVTCGVTTGGAAYCWGWRNPGASAVPLPVSGGLTFALVSTVLLNTCGLTAGGVVYCWGANNTGQLGNGTFTDSWGVPVKVAGQAEGPAGAPTLGVVSDRPGKRRAP